MSNKLVKMKANTSEAYSNISSNDVTILFEEMFNNWPLKTFGICCTYASIPIIYCLCYGIIWFERFGLGNCFFFTYLSLILDLRPYSDFSVSALLIYYATLGLSSKIDINHLLKFQHFYIHPSRGKDMLNYAS